ADMSGSPLRVLVVDDSRIFRAALSEALAACPDVQVVGSVFSGEQALDFCRRSPPDLVTLDLHMPGLSGLETLRSLREAPLASGPAPQATPGVLVVSTLTRAGAEITLQALQAGAFDFIHKPEGPDPAANSRALRRQLLEKLSVFRAGRRPPTPRPTPLAPAPAVRPAPPAPSGSAGSRLGATQWAIPAGGATRFRAVVIGASTGGPAALAQLLPQIAPHSPVPVFVVTHLLAGFSEFLAESLQRRCPEAQIVEAGEGVIAGPRQVFLAPSGRHLRLRLRGNQLCTALDDSPPELGFRPAADVLFRSAAETLRDRVLAVVLTGMDRDGTRGAVAIRDAGGHVVVQDEASSVVWGMPGSVVAAGAAHEIVPLPQLGATLRRHLGSPSPAPGSR
ncbi:MAG: chemotaxis-specific protein-glutamate methyltransferase CheB, partial [Planctomycetaceae bacterium]